MVTVRKKKRIMMLCYTAVAGTEQDCLVKTQKVTNNVTFCSAVNLSPNIQ